MHRPGRGSGESCRRQNTVVERPPLPPTTGARALPPHDCVAWRHSCLRECTEGVTLCTR